MSVAVDANILLYAADQGSPFHDRARHVVSELLAGDESVYLFWPVAIAFVRVSTHSRLFDSPYSLDAAFQYLEELIGHPSVRLATEASGFLQALREVAVRGDARANRIHDAHLAALMRQHGVETIYTNDRDFQRFEGIRALNPLSGSAGA